MAVVVIPTRAAARRARSSQIWRSLISEVLGLGGDADQRGIVRGEEGEVGRGRGCPGVRACGPAPSIRRYQFAGTAPRNRPALCVSSAGAAREERRGPSSNSDGRPSHVIKITHSRRDNAVAVLPIISATHICGTVSGPATRQTQFPGSHRLLFKISEALWKSAAGNWTTAVAEELTAVMSALEPAADAVRLPQSR